MKILLRPVHKFLLRVLLTVSTLTLSTLSGVATAAPDAYIKIQLDSSEAFSGDTIVLDIESTGLLDPIDLSVIEQNTKLLRETTGTRIAVIGGKVQEIAIRRMDLLPKRTGVVVIGPLVAGEITSNTVHIKILDATRPDWVPQHNDAKINVSLTPVNTSVNQQLLLSIELLHRYPINGESITLPELQGFSKRALIENRRTYAGEGRQWFRTDWQYLIYPRQSGSITLDPVTWSGTMAKSNVERAAFSRTSTSVKLDINPAPSDSNNWWLPSDSVVLSESWSSPPTELRAGDELERTIVIKAINVLAGQIPTPSVPESRALQQTLINSSRQETLSKTGVVSSAEFTYRVRAQSPIPVFLDTVRIPWWDTTTNTQREAIIPARRINVGLPDRADLLSRLALQESGVSRLKHRLTSINGIRLLSFTAAIIAIGVMLGIWLPSAIRYARQTLITKTHLRKIDQLAQRHDRQALYTLLQTGNSKQILRGTEKPLLRHLESSLFTQNKQHKTPCLSTMTKALKQQLKNQHRLERKFRRQMASPILADL